MDCKILINFQRLGNAPKADCLEKTAGVLITPLCLACGKYVSVDPESKSPFLEQKQLFLIGRIFMGVVALAILPLTIIGLICASLSTSHQVTYNAFVSKESTQEVATGNSSLPQITVKKESAATWASKKIEPKTSPKPVAPLTAGKEVTASQKTAITSPPVTEKPFVNISTWWEKEEKPKSLSKEEILKSMNSLFKAWNVNPVDKMYEGPEEEDKKPKESPERILNKQIFAFVKSQRPDIATPDEFLWPMQGRRLKNPIPIGEGETFTPEEGQFYRLDEFTYPYLQQPVRPVAEDRYFSYVLKREKDKLYLYLDGGSCGCGVTINGQYYPCQYGRGREEPSILLKEGDDLCLNGNYVSHICTVGKNGTLHLPPQKKIEPQRSEEGKAQTEQFLTQLSKKKGTGVPLQFSSGLRASEIGIEPLKPGFCNPSSIGEVGKKESIKELVFVDFEQDKILSSMAAYLQAEFDIMQYTDEQKMMRLAHLAADLFSEDIFGQSMEHNYFLGELLRSGQGECRHRALLIKALADKLHLSCAYIVGLVDRISVSRGNGLIATMTIPDDLAHAWNIINIGSKHYVVDAMNHCIFDVANVPGSSPERQEKALKFYGAQNL